MKDLIKDIIWLAIGLYAIAFIHDDDGKGGDR